MRALIFAVALLITGSTNAADWLTWMPPTGGYCPPAGSVLFVPLLDYSTTPPKILRDAHGYPVLGLRPVFELWAGQGTPVVPGYWLPSPFPQDMSNLIGGAEGCRF